MPLRPIICCGIGRKLFNILRVALDSRIDFLSQNVEEFCRVTYLMKKSGILPNKLGSMVRQPKTFEKTRKLEDLEDRQWRRLRRPFCLSIHWISKIDCISLIRPSKNGLCRSIPLKWCW